MTRYTVQLYTENGDQIHGRGINCNRKDIPDMLAGVVASYLKDAPTLAPYKPWSTPAGTTGPT